MSVPTGNDQDKNAEQTARQIRSATRCLGLAIGALVLCLCALLVYNLPSVNGRLGWRVDGLQSQVYRWLNPPEELVFVPQGTQLPPPQPAVQTRVQATLGALLPGTPLPAAALPAPAVAVSGATPAVPGATPAVPGATQPGAAAALPAGPPTATATAAPTPTPTALPPQVRLAGLVHEYQQFNNCGPANLSMALSYWGWQGDQRTTRAFLRPNLDVDDKNVNPSEMVAFVEQNTSLRALARVGGDPALLRSLLAAGFPVIIEAGHDPRNDWWMGHYLVVTGYDDALGRWTVQDSLTNPDLATPYDELGPRWWRDFNYVYVIPYRSEREADLNAILGARLDITYSYHLAEQRALEEIPALQGRDLFFAWFNLGSSRVGLQDYARAAEAYDQAFALYQQLVEDDRPYRLMWYQSGPYEAYYYTGRYQYVVSLANTTFAWVGKPVLEESYYWRGLAYAALGKNNQAVSDLQKAAALNPNYAAPRQALQGMGAAVP